MTLAVPTSSQIGMASCYSSLKVKWFGPPKRDLKQRVLFESNVASSKCVVEIHSQRNMIKFTFLT